MSIERERVAHRPIRDRVDERRTLPAALEAVGARMGAARKGRDR